nr:Hpt domain-containing protein [Pseudoruegeria sp. HB172150]
MEELDAVLDQLRGTPAPADLALKLHFLKGSALNLGFATMATLCAQGERMATSGQGQDVRLDDLFSAHDTSRAEFLARFSGIAAA